MLSQQSMLFFTAGQDQPPTPDVGEAFAMGLTAEAESTPTPKTRPASTLVKKLKEEKQDFEWYPTTRRMITTVFGDINRRYHRGSFSFLDIGAGDGRVFQYIDEAQGDDPAKISHRYAIEKSRLLIEAMPADVCIVGTEFHEQSLIDKKVDVLFCNPPYSEYEAWTAKIIREANACHIYLIIPSRWTESAEITDAIKRRDTEAQILCSTDFSDAPRKARARVDILHLDLRDKTGYYSQQHSLKVDPFDLWFTEQFPVEIGHAKEDGEPEPTTRTDKFKALVHGKNQVQSLVQLYREDLDLLLSNYKAVGTLDPDILQEIGVSVDGLKLALKQKIEGLKHLYWQELFEKMHELTSRLTTSTREKMIIRLNSHMHVDFTETNIYAVVIWALKNVNQYIESQLLEVYMDMTSDANAQNYKSNTHMTRDGWRYCQTEDYWKIHHHYSLDYRLVLSGYSAIGTPDGFGQYEYPNNLHKSQHDRINDILTVANNLGFPAIGAGTTDREWETNTQEKFSYTAKGGAVKTFCEIRAFKNGNIHIKACQEFIRALNIEAARLNGWIKSPSDAAREMQDMTLTNAQRYYSCNLNIGTSALLLT